MGFLVFVHPYLQGQARYSSQRMSFIEHVIPETDGPQNVNALVGCLFPTDSSYVLLSILVMWEV